MGDYNFISPGAAALDGMQQALAAQAALKRQQLLDAIAQANQQREARATDANIREQAARTADEHESALGQAALRHAQELEANQRAAGLEQQQTAAVAGQHEIGDDLSALPTDQQSLLTKHGFAQAGAPGVVQGAQTGVDENDVPQYDVKTTPGVLKATGTQAQRTQKRLSDALKGVDVSDRDAVAKAVVGIVPPQNLKEYVDGVSGPAEKKPRDLYIDRSGHMSLIGPNGAPQPLPADFTRRPEDVVHQQPAPAAEVLPQNGGYTDATIDMLAQQQAIEGHVPALSRNPSIAALQTKITNRAAQYNKATGLFNESNTAPNLASSKGDFASDKASEVKLQGQVDAIEAFASTAKDNAKLYNDVMSKVVDTGSPWVNKPVRAILQGAFGSTAVSAVQVMRQSLQAEYGRLTSNPNLTGVLTESARQDMEKALNDNATPEMIKKALDLLQAESDNRHKDYSEQLKVVKDRIKGGGDAPAAGATPTKRIVYGMDGKPVSQ